jgi:hypothetical protein
VVVRLALERLKEKEHWHSHDVVAGAQARMKVQAEKQDPATVK